MIKPLIRWSMTLGVAGAAFLSWGAIENLKAIALPEAEVLEKLRSVPVFTIADEQGAPVVASGQDETKVAGVFISQTDANNFFDKLKTENPELAEKVKVVPVSLEEVYKLAESAQDQDNAFDIYFVPEADAVASAKTIGEENNQPYQGGVPLFVARGGEEKGFLTIEQNSQQVIPFFFEKEQLEEMVNKYKEQEPDQAASVDIQVLPLEGVIENLETSSDETLQKIFLVPTTESLQFLQNASAPAPAPAPGSEEATPEQ